MKRLSITLSAVTATLLFLGCSSSNNDSKDTNTSSSSANSSSSSAILTAPISMEFDAIDVPLGEAQEHLQAASKVTVDGAEQQIGFMELMKTGQSDNGELFGHVKNYLDQPIMFDDGSPYVCSGTNDGKGSGLDYSSILQKNGKLYMVSQFECQIGAMYMFELNQDADTGALSPKEGTLKFISQKSEFGGYVHCAGQTTPWNSHLGSEEYEVDGRMVEANGQPSGNSYYDEVVKYWDGDYTKMNPYYYNWTPEVQIDATGEPVYTKHYSMGRFSHELAYVMPDSRTVYLTDDGSNVGLYMFIADTAEDLTSGTLYAAKFTQKEAYRGGAFDLEWIDLGHAGDSEIRAMVAAKPSFSDMFDTQDLAADDTCGNGFTPVNTSNGAECLKVKSGMELQASRLETRRYAAVMGATTELNKEEGVTYDPIHNKLYVAISTIANGMEDFKAGGVESDKYDQAGYNHLTLPDNSCGGVYALDVAADAQKGSEYVASNFNAILVGETKDYLGTDYEGNSCDVDSISNPDNISYTQNTNELIIGEDTSGHRNNMVWAYNVESGELKRILATPLGAEATSAFWHRDVNGFSYLTAVTQHPSTGDKQSVIGVLGAVRNASNEVRMETTPAIKVPDYTVPGPGDIEGEKPACYESGDGLVFKSTFECAALLPWQAYSVAGSDDWRVSSYGGNFYAYSSGYGADEATEDWLISPRFELSGDEVLTFDSAKGYSGSDVVVYISQDYSGEGDPSAATWTQLDATMASSDNGNYVWTNSGDVSLAAYTGTAYIAFYHKAQGTGGGEVANWEIDNVVVKGSGNVVIPFEVSMTVDSQNPTTLTAITFGATVSGGTSPYTYAWDFGDGTTSTEEAPTHTFSEAGEYTVKVTITDSENATTMITQAITVSEALNEAVPAKMGALRVATFNAYLNRASHGELASEMESGDNDQIKNVAAIIQHVNPDVILLNEFDFDGNAPVQDFINNYLNVAQGSAQATDFPYFYTASVNTGLQPDVPQDFNNDGETGTADDAYGFGEFEGQYGMVILSKYPIDTANIRTFQTFLWKDMPDAALPINADDSGWYSADELAIFRLSSKSHWDIPVTVDGDTVHMLASHPTPPVFDGDEDRNGKRNHDEIRFWADYVAGATYIYDDAQTFGGLAAQTRFVILGDENADPDEGDSYENAIMQLLDSAMIDTSFTPMSEGAVEDGEDADDTANWGMRADYVLPSVYGFIANQSGVFWPKKNDIKHALVEQNSIGGENSSDHRLVWVDLSLSGDAPVTTLSEDFEGGTLGAWTAYSVASNKDWYVDEYGGTKFAKMSGFGGDEPSNDWLISPAIELTGSQTLSFTTMANYTGPVLKVMISTDYSGEGDPTAATWSELSATLSESDWTLTPSGAIDLSAYTGTGYIAFVYTSTDSESKTYEVDDIVLQ